jgi:hypothetical protein
MNKYASGKIYQIISPDGSKYIGSTISTLVSRFGNHRRLYKSWKNGKTRHISVFTIFDVHGVENCKIELIEAFPCSSKKELEKREGEIIKNTTCINQLVAGRTPEEYRNDNKDTLKQKFKVFYEENKEREQQRVKQYYIENKDTVIQQKKVYAQENQDKIRERKRKYNTEHSEEIKEQKRKWRELNRDKINARKRELRALKKQII